MSPVLCFYMIDELHLLSPKDGMERKSLGKTLDWE